MTHKMTGPYIPAPSGKTDSILLILHGYGADGTDLADLGAVWQESLPNMACFAPHAPFPCDGSPYGRQWFPLFDMEASMKANSLIYLPAAQIWEGLAATAAIIDSWIDDLLAAENIAPPRFVISGFSQGCMLSLHTGLRRSPQIGGIMGFSGKLAMPEKLSAEIKSRPPVLLTHGDADMVVPFSSLAEAEAALRQNNVPIETHPRPGLAHGIDEKTLQYGASFLKRILG